jgi:hypothetical protein
MRRPDLTIGPLDNPQTLRWHLLRIRGWQLALHKWLRSDDDRALHDHSSFNVSLILNGGYYELFSWGVAWRRPWRLYFRRAETPHRVMLPRNSGPVWSLWLRGPPFRNWGFHCPKGWRPWQEYVAERDYSAPGSTSTVGKGCD